MCRLASEIDKKEFFQKVNESKAKNAKGSFTKNKYVKFDEKAKKMDDPDSDDEMQQWRCGGMSPNLTMLLLM